MHIQTRHFSGERPQRDNRNLEPNEADIALDANMQSSVLRPVMGSVVEEEGIDADVETIIFFKGTWFTFADAVDIFEYGDRLFWTTSTGEARQATFDQMVLGVYSSMGVPSPDDPAYAVNAIGSGTPLSTSILYTFVNQFGEEGDRSEVTDLFDVEPGDEITYSNINEASTSNSLDIIEYNLVATRIYRLSEGEYKFVTEVPNGTTTFVETVGAITLAESFATDDFDPPPNGMKGLHLMSNGIAIGFTTGTENLVWVSEPFNPNAWPYFFPVKSVPVGLSSYDNYAVVLTDGYPEVASINDPRNIIPTVLTHRQPCVAKRSIVQGMGGVAYASTDSLFWIGHGGGRHLTKNWLDQRDWEEYAPSTMVSAWREGQYLGFHQGAKAGSCFVFDTREANAVVRQLSQGSRAVFVKPGTNELYVADNGTTQIVELIPAILGAWNETGSGAGGATFDSLSLVATANDASPGFFSALAGMQISSGKKQWQTEFTNTAAFEDSGHGISSVTPPTGPGYLGNAATEYGLYDSGFWYQNAAFTNLFFTASNGDILTHKLDMDAGTYEIDRNGGGYTTIDTGLTGSWGPAIAVKGAAVITANFSDTGLAEPIDSGFSTYNEDAIFGTVGGPRILELEASDTPLDYKWRSKIFGDGSPFALTSRRVLSCNHVDRAYVAFDQDTLDAEAAVRAAELAARSAFPAIFGITGGAVNGMLISGVGTSTLNPSDDQGTTINGGQETDLTLSYDYFVTLNVYRDKELVHTEEIRDDEAINRLDYFDRGRYYTYELEGSLEIQQIDLAGSNSEMYSGS